MAKHRYRENIDIIENETVNEPVVEEPIEETEVLEMPEIPEMPIVAEPVFNTVKVTAAKLNIRSSKDSSSDTNIIGMLFKDDEVSGTFEDDWFKLSTNGYVMSKFVK